MRRVVVLLLLLASLRQLDAQAAVAWKISGATEPTPGGCSVDSAVVAIDRWFKAYNAADLAGFARSTAWRTGFVFSTGKHWVVGDTHRRFNSLHDMVAYARRRRANNERLTLEQVTFHGWRDERRLGFMPHYSRSADDLGPKPIPGLGKAEYWCGQGIGVLNLAPVKQELPGK